jgi:hypothetical protein
MNNSNTSPNDSELLTVAEYSRKFSISENTVRTRLNRKKLKTTRGVRDGRETILIVVESFSDHSLKEFEQSETVHEVADGSFVYNNEQSDQLFDFMRETFSTVQAYNSQIVELSRENERYKLITENSSRQANSLELLIEQLKVQLYEKEAKIKEIEAANPSYELEAKIKQLEAALLNKDLELQSLSTQLESERDKGLIRRLFGK